MMNVQKKILLILITFIAKIKSSETDQKFDHKLETFDASFTNKIENTNNQSPPENTLNDASDKLALNIKKEKIINRAMLKKQKQLDHWDKLMEPLDEIYEKNFKDDIDAMSALMGIAPRALGHGLQASNSRILRAINPYGCWCNFENMPSYWGGEPVNEFDKACKTLQLGYRCIQIDLGEKCVSIADEYTISPKYTSQRDNTKLIKALQQHCEIENPGDNCGYSLCIVEAYFINTIFNLLMTGQRIDLSKSHKVGFDQTEHCGVKSKTADSTLYADEYMLNDGYDYIDGGNDSLNIVDSEVTNNVIAENTNTNNAKTQNTDGLVKHNNKPKALPDECCGHYPKRQPFNQGILRNKQCCNERSIYNNLKDECCANGLAANIISGC